MIFSLSCKNKTSVSDENVSRFAAYSQNKWIKWWKSNQQSWNLIMKNKSIVRIIRKNYKNVIMNQKNAVLLASNITKISQLFNIQTLNKLIVKFKSKKTFIKHNLFCINKNLCIFTVFNKDSLTVCGLDGFAVVENKIGKNIPIIQTIMINVWIKNSNKVTWKQINWK